MRNILFVAPRIKIMVKINLERSLKRNATFRPASTGLDHVLLVACGLTQSIVSRDNDLTHMYIEVSKQPRVRFKEHLNLDKPTGGGEHCLATGHSVSKNNIKVLCREQEWQRRKVKEAIYIKQHGPTMNRDQGYQLPPIYTQILPPVSGSSHRQPMSNQDL